MILCVQIKDEITIFVLMVNLLVSDINSYGCNDSNSVVKLLSEAW